MSRRVRFASLVRSQRGQGSIEYAGVLLVIALVIGALFTTDLPGKVGLATDESKETILSGEGGPGRPGGGGPGTPGDPDGDGRPGTPGDPDGDGRPGGDPGGGEDGDASGGNATALAACLSSGRAYGYCLKAFDPARYYVETRPTAALNRVDDATKAILNSGARPGTPEYERLVRAREQAVNAYLATKPTANNKVLRAINNTKKVLDPRARDLAAVRNSYVGKTPPPPPAPNTSSGGPRTASSASKVLKGLSKVGKGLGIVGTGLGLVSNVKNDGVAKGVTKTAGGLAGATAFGAGAAAVCAGLAVTGVGAVACGVGVLAAGVIGSEVGSRAAGWMYDNALAPAGEAIGNVAEGAAEKVSEGFDAAKDAGGKVLGAFGFG